MDLDGGRTPPDQGGRQDVMWWEFAVFAWRLVVWTVLGMAETQARRERKTKTLCDIRSGQVSKSNSIQ
jgi:hypothetical protein